MDLLKKNYKLNVGYKSYSILSQLVSYNEGIYCSLFLGLNLLQWNDPIVANNKAPKTEQKQATPTWPKKQLTNQKPSLDVIIYQKQKTPKPKSYEEMTGDGDKNKSDEYAHRFPVKHPNKKLAASKSAHELLEDDKKTSRRWLKEERTRRCKQYVEDHFRSLEDVGRSSSVSDRVVRGKKKKLRNKLEAECGRIVEIPSNRKSNRSGELLIPSKNTRKSLATNNQAREEKLPPEKHVKQEDNTLDDISDSVMVEYEAEFDLDGNQFVSKTNNFEIPPKLTQSNQNMPSKSDDKVEGGKEQSSVDVEVFFDNSKFDKKSEKSETGIIYDPDAVNNSKERDEDEEERRPVYLEKATQCSYQNTRICYMIPDNFHCQKQNVSTQTCFGHTVSSCLPLMIGVSRVERGLLREVRMEGVRQWLKSTEECSSLTSCVMYNVRRNSVENLYPPVVGCSEGRLGRSGSVLENVSLTGKLSGKEVNKSVGCIDSVVLIA